MRATWLAVALVSVLLVGLGALAAKEAKDREAEKARAELMDADRAFAAAAKARGIDGWMEFMTADAARLPRLGAEAVRGAEAIRKADTPLFADPKRRLTWEPKDAGLFADGRHGFTTGNYRVLRTRDDGSEEVAGRGSYVTWWRKEPSGKWRVILDTGAPEPPAAPKQP